jgi:hypothetical protein
MKWTKLSALLITVSATGTIIDNNAPSGNDHLPATRSDGIRLYIEQPFCSRDSYTFVPTNAAAEVRINDSIVTVPAGALLNGIGTNNCGYN